MPDPGAPEPIYLAYGPDSEQFGTLFLPEGPGPFPVVAYLHGGYWRARYNHAISSGLCADLARRGIAAWNMEYRRVGDVGGGWPDTFEDVALGVDHLRTLAQSHPMDLARVLVMGHSAGGHLALWAAARGRVFPALCPNPLPLRAVIAQAPVADPRLAWEWHLSHDAVVDLLGGTPNTVPERYAAASPGDFLPLGVPLIMLHGTADDAVPYAMAEVFAERARAAGDLVTFITQPGAGHFEMVTPGTPEWEQTVGEAVRALY